jgi:hypothetical protein
MNHPVPVLRRRSDRADLLGPRALGAAADGELDPLVFLKAAVTASFDGGMVDEEVGRAVVGGDETMGRALSSGLATVLATVTAPWR